MSSDRWSDLLPRVMSAIVMAAVGGVAITLGGPVFTALVLLATAAMIWELARMTHADAASEMPSRLLGFAAAACLLVVIAGPSRWTLLLLLVPSVAGLLLPRRDKAVYATYALAVMITGFGLILLRDARGIQVILWLLLVVVTSDVLGYFAGRILGGPKFWPAISPKKTWSGTAAGWIGAAVVGAAFFALGQGGAALIWLSPLVAFAGQLGDIAESAIKRRAGIKDSSNLIPGHGGALDRFDALIGAVVVVSVLTHLTSLPIGGN